MAGPCPGRDRKKLEQLAAMRARKEQEKQEKNRKDGGEKHEQSIYYRAADKSAGAENNAQRHFGDDLFRCGDTADK